MLTGFILFIFTNLFFEIELFALMGDSIIDLFLVFSFFPLYRFEFSYILITLTKITFNGSDPRRFFEISESIRLF